MGLLTQVFQDPIVSAKAARPSSAKAPTPTLPTDANHLFANNVRFLSMAAVIAGHTVSVYSVFRHSDALPWALVGLVQLFKFGTIGFFLISGFLFGERIDQYSPLQYYGRRLKNVLLPWFVWYLCYCGLRFAVVSLHSPDASGYLYTEFIGIGLLATSYWFVPNLLLALAILLVFRRVLRDKRVGAVFAMASLIYAANIYGHWFPVQHSRAVFGFVFYLWLGAWGAWHFASLQKWLARVPVVAMLGFLALTHGLAMGEAKLLFALHSADPVNTLRITNQTYSIVVVLAIMKLRNAAWPRLVDVRMHTFGLYLTHPIGLAALKLALPHVASAPFWGSRVGAALSLPMAFAMTYGSCMLIIRGLLSFSWLRWTVGLGGSTRSKAVHPMRQLDRRLRIQAESPGVALHTDRQGNWHP